MLIERIEKDKDMDLLKGLKKSIILLQGIFEDSMFDMIKKKKKKEVFVLEGRPSLEAAKFSCRELIDRNIQPTLISDNMAGFLFYKNLVREVWLSYQTVDSKGALCQIGGLVLGVLSKRHKVPVNLYPNGKHINLIGQQREIFYFNGTRIAPDNIKGYVPLVEWVPNKYITNYYE